MYKKQMAFQKIVCFAVLAAAALVFVYSLGLVTDLYDSLFRTIRSPEHLDRTQVAGSRIYYDIQPFNSSLTNVGIGLILISLVLFLMNTQIRRKYYIGNYVAIALSVVANIAATVWAVPQIAFYKATFLQIDFVALKEYAESWKSLYTESTFWFDAGYVVFGVLILTTVLLVLNLIWKIKVMKEEKRMIGSGKEGKA